MGVNNLKKFLISRLKIYTIYMEKEDKIIAILLVMIILSLGIAYAMIYTDSNMALNDGRYQLVCLYESELSDKIYFEGIIMDKRITRTGNHLILNVDYNSNDIEIFIPNNAGAINLKEKLNKGNKIYINGIVNEFRGRRQIKIQNEQDIRIKSN